MFDQLFDGFRKASESSFVAQQELVKQWVQQWPSASLGAAGSAIECNSTFHKQWVDLATRTLNLQRELLDSSLKAGLESISRATRVTDARSPDELRMATEELWRTLFQRLKEQAEAQFVEMKNAFDTSISVISVPDQATA